MSRNMLFVALLLATGVALADDPPAAEPAAEPAAGPAAGPAAETPAEAPAEPGARAAETQAQAEEEAKLLSGMSVLGNQEAPKSLVIVPWKTSELGDSLGISTMLDDSRQPIDKEVFLRALRYYEIRSE